MPFLTQSGVRGAIALAALVSALASSTVSAQVSDTTRARQVADSVKAAAARDSTARTVLSERVAMPRAQPIPARIGGPPITPRRAFLYSLMLPGLGQSRLDRATSGAFFAAIELGALAMIAKTSIDLNQARRYSGDSIPGNFTVAADGKISVATGSYLVQLPNELPNTRRLHREDWFAAILFNHLISGAEAFVSAQLWDVPTTALSVRPLPQGTALVATIRW